MKRAVCWAVCIGLFMSLLGGCRTKELPSVNIFVTADIEGVFWSRPEPRYGNEVVGGMAVLKSFLDKQTAPFLLLEGGNWFAQTPEGTLSQGTYFDQITSSIPYVGRMFTEKDFVYGWGSLSHILKDSKVPFIVSNVTLANQKLPAGITPYLLKSIGDYKIGVLGIVNSQQLKNKQRLGNLRILPEVEEIRKHVQSLRDKGAQVILVLSGLGMSDDKNILTDDELATEVPEINVIVRSGVNREEAEQHQVGKTLIVYPGSRLDTIGKIQLFFNKNNELATMRFEEAVLYRRDYGEDENIAQKIAELRRNIRGQMSRPVGKNERLLQGKLDGESELGDWAADCLRKWAKADAAVLNAAALRDVLPAGTVTHYDLYKLYPYSDHVTYLTIKGKALLEALEAGLNVPDNFAQISGLKIKYNPQAVSGPKIQSVWVGDNKLNTTGTYRVAVTDHMLAGGAGHDGFIDSLEFKNTQVEMRTVLQLCLSGNKKTDKPFGPRWQEQK